MAQVPRLLIPHNRKVCMIYKKLARCIEDYEDVSLNGRYLKVVLRKRFDDNKDVKDMRKAYALYQLAEQFYEKHKHPSPFIFQNGPGGTAYDRFIDYPDWVLDYWDPMEKSLYPKFFAEREQLKKEYLENYYKQYPDMKKQDEEDAKGLV